jgi:cupin 2 domain-containing protein
MNQLNSIYKNTPNNLPDEFVDILAEGKNFRLERIVSKGHTSPKGFWYDQVENEFVLLLKGEAEILFEDDVKPVRLVEGDYINILAQKKHRVEWTDPKIETIWLALFYW